MLIGADPEQLDAIAREFDAAVARLKNVYVIGRQAAATPGWSGPDAQQFRQQWDGAARARLQQAEHVLSSAAATLRQNASAQRSTSASGGTWGAAASGGTSPGTGTGAPGSGPGTGSPDDWRHRAYERAGIDPTTWQPDRGLVYNDGNVQKVYDYYGRLYERDPAKYQWAGMAKLAGATFYGGWQDLEAIASIADKTERAAKIKQWLDPLLPPGMDNALTDKMVEQLAGFSQDEIHEFMSQYFLPMHRKIFDDMAWMHEAYDAGGIDEMVRLDQAHQLPQGMLDTWRMIDSGDPAKVAKGNELLLYREQHEVIQQDYDRMYHHDAPVGQAFTQLMTWIGNSPIPGGHAYRDVVTQFVGVDVPSVGVGVHTPDSVFGIHVPSVGVGVSTPSIHEGITIPRGNIANFDDRWEWIHGDMLPSYQHFIADDPGQMRQLMDTPISQLSYDKRMFPLLPYDR